MRQGRLDSHETSLFTFADSTFAQHHFSQGLQGLHHLSHGIATLTRAFAAPRSAVPLMPLVPLSDEPVPPIPLPLATHATHHLRTRDPSLPLPAPQY